LYTKKNAEISMLATAHRAARLRQMRSPLDAHSSDLR
jgi:hypothetical protein